MKALSLVPSSPVWGMVLKSGPVVKAVIVVLLVLSVASWTIIFFKYIQIRAVDREDRDFLADCQEGLGVREILALAKKYRQGVVPLVFAELNRWFLLFSEEKRDLEAQWTQVAQQRILLERQRLSSYVGFLATVGNTAPFIGLFGTVWGIINAFQQIGLQGSASLAVVAPGISEALVTTALGLFVAIPAVMGYNYFVGRLSQIEERAEGAAYILVGILEGAHEEE